MTELNEKRLDILTQASKQIVYSVMGDLQSLNNTHNFEDKEVLALFSSTIVYLLEKFSDVLPKEIRKQWFEGLTKMLQKQIDLEKE